MQEQSRRIPVTWDAQTNKPTAPDIEVNIRNGRARITWFIADDDVDSFEIRELGQRDEFEDLTTHSDKTWSVLDKATKVVTAHYKIEGTRKDGKKAGQDPKISNVEK